MCLVQHRLPNKSPTGDGNSGVHKAIEYRTATTRAVPLSGNRPSIKALLYPKYIATTSSSPNILQLVRPVKENIQYKHVTYLQKISSDIERYNPYPALVLFKLFLCHLTEKLFKCIHLLPVDSKC